MFKKFPFLLLWILMMFVIGSACSQSTSSTEKKMERVQNGNQTFSTVQPASWETVDVGAQQWQINLRHNDQSAFIVVSDTVTFITTSDDGESKRNILKEHYESSPDYDFFVQKMVNYHSRNRPQPLKEIDQIEDVPVFATQVNKTSFVYAYPVINEKPFFVMLNVQKPVDDVREIADQPYYADFKQFVRFTKPLEK